MYPVHTSGHKIVWTCMYRVHTGTWILVLHFSRFGRVHACTYWWLLSTYLVIPDYFAGLPSPADLPAGDTCTGTHTDPNRTTYGLLTAAQAACQHLCLPVHDWALVLACLGIQMCGTASPDLLCRHHDQWPARQQHQPLQAMNCAQQMGVWRTWALSWGVDYEQ
jgi:hypothetical protein